MDPNAERHIDIDEPAATPALSLVLGYLAVLPFAAGAVAAWLGGGLMLLAVQAVALWGAAILIFLSGVRRGLSFRTPGGPRGRQIAMVFWLFLAGLVSLVLPLELAVGLLLLGYGSLALLDPPAARRGEAPLFFEGFRPPQMLVAVLGLAAILVRLFA